jgi:hypothetical protein
MKRRLERRFEKAVAEQRLHVATALFDGDAGRGPIYDVDPAPGPRDDG